MIVPLDNQEASPACQDIHISHKIPLKSKRELFVFQPLLTPSSATSV